MTFTRLSIARTLSCLSKQSPPPLLRPRTFATRASFMDMPPHKIPKPRIHLILDWDGTMTLEDTTSNIGEAVLSKAREFAKPTKPPYEHLKEPMAEYVRLYEHDVEQYQASEAKINKARDASHAETDASDGIDSWDPNNLAGMKRTIHDLTNSLEKVRRDVAVLNQRLDRWRDVQTKSLLRVRNAVINKEVEDAMIADPMIFDKALREQARKDEILGKVKIRERPVLKALLRQMAENGNSWSIVSVSWSRAYILGVMISSGLIEGKDADAVKGRIHCNEIMDEVEIDATGRYPSLICDRRDKLAELEKITGETPDPRTLLDANSDVISVYVGDSTTDIDCLAASSAIGMHMYQEGASKQPVWEMLDEMHVDRRKIESLPTRDVITSLWDIKNELKKKKKPPHIVCAIQSFAELRDWIASLEL